MDIMDELKPIGQLYLDKKYEECLKELKLLWDKYPEPKELIGNTYLIILYFVKTLMLLGRKNEALDWALKGILYNGTRNLAGEAELLIGSIAYEMDRIKLAKDMFITAREKGGKRVFKEEKKEYLDLTEEE